MPDDHPSVVRALRERCRDFTQHLQPLVPGWRDLLALRNKSGEPLGMPTGIGWYTHLWLSEMCDGVTMRLSERRDDIEVLLYKRPSDNQSEWVWATPGGYVMRADTHQRGLTPLQVASARRTRDRTGRDILMHAGVPLPAKLPISSGNTLVAGLRSRPYARFIASPDYKTELTIPERNQLEPGTIQAAGYVSVRQLCDYNPAGGSSGAGQADNPFPVWTTHFEYITSGLDALIDTENQHRLGVDDATFATLQEVVTDLQRHPALAPI